MAERGHSLESIKASIEARKPDFDAYIGNLFEPKLNYIVITHRNTVFGSKLLFSSYFNNVKCAYFSKKENPMFIFCGLVQIHKSNMQMQ